MPFMKGKDLRGVGGTEVPQVGSTKGTWNI